MGSAVALFAGLAMTTAVFLLLPEFADRLHAEQRPLFTALAWAGTLTVISSVAFVAELKGQPWRRIVQIALALFLLGMFWFYLPT